MNLLLRPRFPLAQGEPAIQYIRPRRRNTDDDEIIPVIIAISERFTVGRYDGDIITTVGDQP